MLSTIHLAIVAHIVVFSVVFCDLLTRPKMVFGWYGSWLDRLEMNGYGWLAYPIGYCSKCTAGQIALWVFVIRALYGWEPISLMAVRVISFVCLSVLAAEVLSKALARLQRS